MKEAAILGLQASVLTSLCCGLWDAGPGGPSPPVPCGSLCDLFQAWASWQAASGCTHSVHLLLRILLTPVCLMAAQTPS